jgi:ubiquinone/menaquinone biosynthesis C-methylase UbiE
VAHMDEWGDEPDNWPGPADIAYQSQAQAGGFGQTLASFVKFLDLPDSARVLDVGTGPGLMLRLLGPKLPLVVGADESPEMLRHARGQFEPGISAPLLAADALRLPCADASFDAALATNLLFLLPDPLAGLRELARVLRHGGIAGWLNPSDALSQSAAAAFCDGRGMTGFPRFSLINYARIAEQHHRLPGDGWADLARAAGLTDVVVEGRAGGLMTIGKGRKSHG